MKTPMALSVTSSQREQTSLRSQAPRLPRSNVCSTRDLENPSASVHLKRFSTPSLTLKFLCAGKLNPRDHWAYDCKRNTNSHIKRTIVSNGSPLVSIEDAGKADDRRRSDVEDLPSYLRG